MILLAEIESPIFNYGGVKIEAWQIVVALLAVIAAMILPLVIASIVRAKQSGEKFVFTTRDITYAAICVAISYVLSFFGYEMAMGGMITPASILPVAVYCYYFGYRKGVAVCAVNMLLQLTQSPYIINVWSLLLDYLIPYVALSLVGAISYNSKLNKAATTASGKLPIITHWGFFVGMLIYIIIRYTSHVVSGVLFFHEYAAEWGMTPIGYSLAYNTFCVIDMAIAAVAAFFLFMSREFNKVIFTAARSSAAQSANGRVGTQADGLHDSDTAAEND